MLAFLNPLWTDQCRPTPDALLTTQCFLASLLRGHTRHDLANTQDSPLLDALIKYRWFQTLEADSEQSATSSSHPHLSLSLSFEWTAAEMFRAVTASPSAWLKTCSDVVRSISGMIFGIRLCNSVPCWPRGKPAATVITASISISRTNNHAILDLPAASQTPAEAVPV